MIQTPSELDDSIRTRRITGILESAIFNEALLYAPNKNMAVSLNASAKAVWELCDGSLSVTGMTQAIARNMGFTGDYPPALLDDVRAAVLELQALGLVESWQ